MARSLFKFSAERAEQAAHVRSLEAQIAAMDRSQAVIEFKLDGTIIAANANFLGAMGYSAEDVEGRHHSMFVKPEEADSPAYREFWQDLNRGEYVARKFLRIGQGGREVWIQASYNPVLDVEGKPYKVIKFATDVTDAELSLIRSEEERRQVAAEQQMVVDALAAGLGALSRGDLTTTIEKDFQGAYAQLKTDFNHAVTAIRDALSAVSAVTGSLKSGADEIASASDDLSQRTERQAASLEQTAAALDEITATVKRSADGAKQVSNTASEARTEALRSSVVVKGAVAAMEEIEQSSNKITQIISVIDEIAFQTNLLALNAGVEAARAGDAGKGFAVVAQEVRALAQRSAGAAKEIKALISSSTSQVDRGVKLVSETGVVLDGIAGRIADIDELISEIAASAQEQATGLSQVNSAVNQMDQVTQQNAAMVEQATAAAAGLNDDATELSRLIGGFRVGDAASRPEVADVRRHAPQASPARRAQARVHAFAGGAKPAVEQGWEEF